MTSAVTLSSPLPLFIDSPHSCPSRYAGGHQASASLPTSPLMIHKSLTPHTVLPAFTEIICAPTDMKPCTVVSATGMQPPAAHPVCGTPFAVPPITYLPGHVVKHAQNGPSLSQMQASGGYTPDKCLHNSHQSHQHAMTHHSQFVQPALDSFKQYRSNVGGGGSPFNTPQLNRRAARSLSSRRLPPPPPHLQNHQQNPNAIMKNEMTHIILTDQNGAPISIYHPICSKQEDQRGHRDQASEHQTISQHQHFHMHHPVENNNNNNCSAAGAGGGGGGLSQNYEDELSSGLSSCHMSSIIEGRYDHSSLGTKQRNNSLSSNGGGESKFVQYCSGTNGSR